MSAGRLSNEQVTYLLMILRNANAPVTTEELVRALQQRAER